LFILAFIFAPHKGVLWRALRKKGKAFA